MPGLIIIDIKIRPYAFPFKIWAINLINLLESKKINEIEATFEKKYS